MTLLRYEFIDGPEDSINGRLRKLVKELRYNRSMIEIEEFKQAMPNLRKIEKKLQDLDKEIGESHREYIDEIMQELDNESDKESNITDELNRATTATIASMLGKEVDFDDFSFLTGKAEHYHWLQFSGYTDQRAADASILIAREVFRSICNKYNYIFVDLS